MLPTILPNLFATVVIRPVIRYFGLVEETVLIVDDEAGVRELLRRWLVGWGYAVTTAAHVNDALEAMLIRPAHILLVDITSARDGFRLVNQVRMNWPHTAFIMTTAAGDLNVVEKSARGAPVDYIHKPFEREIVWQALDRASRVDALDTKR